MSANTIQPSDEETLVGGPSGLVFEGLAQLQLNAPKYAVVDLRFDDGCGLDVVEAVMQQRPDARGIILTGYGNIATAVKAAKLGAVDYLTKPVDADDIVSALQAPLGGKAEANHPRLRLGYARVCGTGR
jgi:two-component system response regulator RegA